MGKGIRNIVFALVCLLLYCVPCFSADDFSAYMDDLRAKIQKSWNPPDCMEKNGHALVKFSITRNGEIYYTEMVENSGDPVFDESAMEALRKASPFAHFPAETSRGSLTIQYSFDTEIVNTGNMQKYLSEAEKLYNVNNREALYYINRAIEEVEGDIRSYFLYAKRGKIRQALGDKEGSIADIEEAKRLKTKYDRKRIMTSKIYAEMEQSPYSYFALAHAYDIAGDYENAIKYIDKAISLTNLNQQYKRYKKELEDNLLLKN